MQRYYARLWWVPLLVVAAVVVQGHPAAPTVAQSTPQLDGFRALSGAQARSFELPNDVRLERTLPLRSGGTLERYQQYVGGAKVLGGQLALYRDASGSVVNVIGAHFPGIPAPGRPPAGVGPAPAEFHLPRVQVAGHPERRIAEQMIHPETGRRFTRVELRAFASRWVEDIDSETGVVFNRYNALEFDHGLGVKDGAAPDFKPMGDGNSADALTTQLSASNYQLLSKNSRQHTLNLRNCTGLFCSRYEMYDDDNHWIEPGDTPGTMDPGQEAAVDAHYYARIADTYYQTRHGLDWLQCTGLPGMRSVVHQGANYNNAFWNGQYLVYGDGDGTTFSELSGGLDVVAHEATHAVTGCTSALQYQNESGALNEAFSDIMGTSVEFFAQEGLASNCVVVVAGTCADWAIGEDISLSADAVPGLRNMADPAEDGDPDHYVARYTGPDDNGGVHSNSGIPNHAYYLLVNSGKRAGCGRPGDHGTDCSITVSGIGLLKAEQIFLQSFVGLNATATMSNARDATVARARVLYPGDCPSVAAAWQAVGVSGTATCEAPPPVALPARVNAGGAAYTDGQGQNWAVDTGFVGGTPYSTTAVIDGTTDGPLYQNERFGYNFLYGFAVPNGTYTVTLKFAEIYFNSPGQRVFNVAIEGQPVLSNFDILAEVPKNTALDKVFPVNVTDEVLAILFTTVADNAKVSAIEIRAGTTPPPTATPTSGPSPIATATATPTATSTSTPSPALPLRVNTGGGTYTDGQGQAWAPDTGFSGGGANSTTAAIAGTTDGPLYQTERYGNVAYSFAVPNGTYTVTLKFAELYWTTAGKRVFNVAIEGQPVLSKFDILKEVPKNTALDKVFVARVSDGVLNIQFTTVADNATVAAIRIDEGATTSTLPVRVNSGGGAYTDGQGQAWVADSPGGGGTYSTTAAINGTTDGPLYQTERYGSLLHSFAVPNGTYTVTLKFAEIYFNAVGQRKFNVVIEGQTVLSNFDIRAEVPKNTALDKVFPVSVNDGVLEILFTTVVENAKVSAIEIRAGTTASSNPEATPTPTGTATPTPEAAATSTPTGTPTATATPTATTTATLSPTPTGTPTPTATATLSPTATGTPTATATSAPTATATPGRRPKRS